LGTLTPATADAARKPMQARIKKLTFILTWFLLKLNFKLNVMKVCNFVHEILEPEL
jgi:hypothetical protein